MRPHSTPRAPLEYPGSIPEYPPSTPSSNPRRESGPRTSVGARPHVVVEDGGDALAADDVDGAGGVDHGRVRLSRSPLRAGRAARPRDTCGRTRATTGRSHRTQPRTAPRRTHALATHMRGIAIRWNRTNPYMRSQRNAYLHAHARAQMDTNTYMSTRANAHAHARARSRT